MTDYEAARNRGYREGREAALLEVRDLLDELVVVAGREVIASDAPTVYTEADAKRHLEDTPE